MRLVFLSALLFFAWSVSPRRASAAAFTHTTTVDFSSSSAAWSGLGSSVTATVGDGGVQLAYRSAEALGVVTSTPLPAALTGPGLVFSNNRLFYIGGDFVSTVYGSSVSADGSMSAWSALSGLTSARYYPGVAAWNGRLYAAGGQPTADANGRVSSVEYASISSDGSLTPWTLTSSMPSVVTNAAAAAWNGFLYVMGGYTTYTSVVSAPIKADGSLGTWTTQSTTLPGNRQMGAAVAYNGKLYYLGGQDNAGVAQSTVYSASVGADGTVGTWGTEAYALPAAVGMNSAAVWNGRIYVGGGVNSGGASVQTVYSSSISANGSLGPWMIESAAIPSPVNRAGMAAGNGALYVVAGAGPPGDTANAYIFPLNSGGALGSWTTNATQMSSKWSGVDAFVYGGKLHAIGGQSDGAWVSSAAAAAINGDGSVGSMVVGGGQMAETNGGYRRASVMVNGWVYSLWQNYNVGQGKFEFAQLCSTGTLCGGWQSQVWNGAQDGVVLVAYSSTIYAMAGYNVSGSAYQTRVDYATVCSTGTMCSAWNSATALPSTRYMGVGGAWNGRLYYATGRDGGSTAATVSYAPINADGSLGSWSATTSYPSSIENGLGGIWDGVFYIYGGGPTNTASVYGARINSDGTLGTWIQQASLPNALASSYSGNFATKWKGKVYLVGGDINSATSNNIYYAGSSSYTAAGSYFNLMDLGTDFRLSSVTWSATLNSGTLAVSISTASTSSSFSPWVSVTSAAALGTPTARYVRYRVDLASATANTTPVLSDLTVGYLPNPPTISTPTAAAASSLTANWTNSGNPASVSYRVQAATEPAFTTISATADSGAGATSQALTGLSPNTTYYVRSIALDGGATSYAATSGYAISSNSVVALWHFDEGSGTASADSSGNGNGATLVNGPSWVNAYAGKGLSFNGASSQYVSVPDGSYVRLGANNFTITAWINTTSDGTILDKEAGSSPFAFYRLWISGGKMAGAASDCGTGACGWGSSRNPVNGNITVTDGKWHHVALTRNGATLSLYVDGVLDATHADASAWNTDNSTFLSIAAVGGVSTFLTGMLDELVITTRCFSATEIRQAMGSWPATTPLAPPLISTPTVTTSSLTVNWSKNGNPAAVSYRVQASTEPTFTTIAASADSSAGATSQALTGLTAGATYYTRAIALSNSATSFAATSGYAVSSDSVVGIWHFDEGSGTGASDSSNNGNAGALTSTSWTLGRFTNALSFNGSSSYVEMPKTASLNVSGSNLTVAAWIVIQGNGVNYPRIILGGQVNSTYELLKGNNADDRILFVPKGSGGLYSATALSRNVWHHVVGTYDGTTSKIYIDGVLDNSFSESGAIPTNGSTFLIGGETGVHEGNSNPSWFNGLIDEVVVATRTYSATEVRQLMGSWPVTTYPNPPTISAPAATATGLTANWTSNGNSTTVSYRVQAATEPAFTTISATADTAANATSQALTGLSPNTTYYTRAIALVNGASSYTTASGFLISSNAVTSIWHFEEGSGSTAYDSTVNGNNGTLNSTTWTTGVFGGGLSFDGSSSYVSLAAAVPASNLTVGAWVRPSSVAGTNTIWAYADATGYSESGFWISAGHVVVSCEQDASNRRNWGWSDGPVLQAGQWYHVAFTQAGCTATPTIYVNGEAYTPTVATSVGTPGRVSAAGAIGRMGAYASGAYFNGLIDEVFVASRTYSATEIRQTMGAWSVPTLTQAPLSGYQLSVFTTSATVNWPAFAASPSSMSANGFIFQASTATNYSGVLFSSTTLGIAQSTLTLVGLIPNTNYNFQLTSLNLNNATNYAAIGPVYTQARPPVPADFVNGSTATIILGQTTPTGHAAVSSQSGMSNPSSVHVNFADGSLWVGDEGVGCRVTQFVPPFVNGGMNASVVLGKPDFVTACGGNGVTQNLGGAFQEVWPDANGNVWAMDWTNSRALRFTAPYSSSMYASMLIGQSTWTNTGSAATAAGLNAARGVTFDAAGNLWISDFLNYRVLEYLLPLSNGMSASLVIGQANFTSGAANQGGAVGPNTFGGPAGIAFDASGALWVADYGNHRVLRFTPPFSTNMNADLVLGQADFTHNSANRGGSVAANTLSAPPRVGLDGDGNMWVADANNNRVLRYSPPFSNGMNATLVLGQADLTHGLANQNNSSTPGGGYTMYQPFAASPDVSSGTLWVADDSNARVLGFTPTALTVLSTGSLQIHIGANFNGSGALYALDLSTNSDFNTVWGTINTSALTISTGGLLGQTTYYLRGRTQNGGGLWSPYNYLGSTMTANLAAAPILSMPADQAAISTSTPIMTWSPAVSGTHRLQLSLNSAFTQVVADSTTANSFYFSTNTLTSATTYWWRVQAWTNFGNWSSTRSFIVDLTSPAFSSPQVSTSPSGVFTALPMSTYLSSYVVTAQVTIQDPASGLFVSTGLPSGLIGQWHLDESSGTAALDASPNGYTGAVVGNTTWTGGRKGSALKFDGSTGAAVNVGFLGNAVGSPGSVFSYESWIKLASVGATGFIASQYYGAPTSGYWSWYLSINASGVISLNTGDSQISGYTLNCSTAVTDTNWHHVAFTYNGGPIVMYLDGWACGSGTSGQGGATDPNPVTFGADPAAGDPSLNGSIDDIRLFSVIRSSVQILADYQSDTLAAQNRGAAYNVLYSTNGGATWAFVSTSNVTFLGSPGNGTTGAQTVQVSSIPLVTSTGPAAVNNEIEFVFSDWAGNVSTAVYTVFVDTLIPPTPVSPAGGAAVSTTNPVMSWSAYTVKSQRLQLAQDSAFTQIIADSTTANNFYVSTNVLTNATTYWWRVQNWLNDGNWSSVSSFVVDVVSPTFSSPQVSTSPSGVFTALPMSTYLSSYVVTAQVTIQDPASGLFVSTGLPSGLIGQWHLDEASGTVALDSSPNGYTGSIVGNSTWTTGRKGAGLKFDGSTGAAVNVGFLGNAVGSPGSVFTYEGWMKLTSVGNTGFIASQYYGAPTSGYWSWYLSIDASGVISVNTGDSQISGYTLSCSTAVKDTNWHHVAFTYNGGPIVIYLDGWACASGTSGQGGATDPNPVTFGGDPAAGDPSVGSIDEVRLFSVIRSSVQILADYQSDTLAAHNRGAAYNVRYSTNAGSTWNYVSTASVSIVGGAPGNGSIGAATVQITSVSFVSSSATIPSNLLAFSFSDVAGNVSTATYAVLVDTRICTGPFAYTFTNPTLTARTSVLRAVHFIELRSDIDALRSDARLTAYPWTTPAISTGTSVARGVDVTDMRTAVNAVYTACGQSPPSYTDPTISANSTKIRAVHITELRTAVQGAK